MVTVKGVFDKLGLPQSNHVRSYIGVLVSERARNMQVEIGNALENGTIDDPESYWVNAYPDEFENEIRDLILKEPAQKRPRIKFKKVDG